MNFSPDELRDKLRKADYGNGTELVHTLAVIGIYEELMHLNERLAGYDETLILAHGLLNQIYEGRR